MAEILKGAPVASSLTEKLITHADSLKKRGVTPTLAMLRVGEKAGDISYETGATKRCEKIGIDIKKIILPEKCRREKVIEEIHRVNRDKNIHAFLMFRPLDDKDTERSACEALSPAKDADCMTPSALAGVFTGSGTGYPPCTAGACLELLDYYGVELSGKHVVIIGRSLVIGKPVSMLMLSRNATVTICHSRTKFLPEICREADVIIAAVGKAGFVGTDFVREGQIVIDVGINLDANGNLCGDVNFPAVEPVVKAITPVPAGVGAITTAVLAKHVIEAAEKSC